MNLITEHLDIWTTAQTPKTNGGRGRGRNTNSQTLYGIKKLRELILELAVRGKLVPQDLKDEPASVLLKKITKEKARLIKEGKIKKQKPLPEIGEDEKPFGLPVGWAVTRLGNLINLVSGQHLKPQEYAEHKEEGMVPYLTGPAEFGDQFPLATRYTFERRALASAGDILMTCKGSGVGKLNTADREIAISRQLMSIQPIVVNTQYIKLLAQSMNETFREKIVGIAIPGISREDVRETIIKVSPLSEQNRIVAKVDELMDLCDQLEEQQTDSNATHQTLVETLLTTLTNAADQEEFSETWQRIADHFDTLFTTEQSIDRLKQTILQLAVMGKLVPQDPNDEPASVLLAKIAKEKTRLIKKGKIKKQKPLPEITDEEKPFELPSGWEWARIGDATLFTEYGMSEKTFHGIKGIPVLKMGDIQDGKLILGGQKLVPETAAGLPSLYLKKWDLLYNRTNSAELVGKTGIYLGPDDAYTFASYLVRIRCSENSVDPVYLNLAMNTPLFRTTQIEPHLKQQCGQANVNATVMRNMIVPVSPIAEQHRIVAKVDELMAICDNLKARLNDAQAIQMEFADAVPEKAVA